MPVLKKMLFLIGCFISIISFSQADEATANVANYHFDIIDLPLAVTKIKIEAPVSSIEVHDVRFDTSCIGIDPMPQIQRLHILRLKNSLPSEVKRYYQSLLDSTILGTPELHCFIKKLILSDFIDANNIDKQKISSKSFDAEIRSGILFMAEFYYKRDDDYIPLCRFDTTITGNKNIDKVGGAYIAEALTASIKKVSLLNIEKIKQNKGFKIDDIVSFNNKRFRLPILNSTPVKGLYLSFKDFLNNTPSSKEFTVDKNPRGDFLYIKNEKNEDILFTDLWGYCDGKNMYIFSASNYFKLQRTGNSFKVYGAKDFTAHRNFRLSMRPIDVIAPNSTYSKANTQTKYSLVKNFFQLDMDTGELY